MLPVGTHIRQVIYTNRGKKIHRHGLILKMIDNSRAKVLWFTTEEKCNTYATPLVEIIKLELIEVLNEPKN